MSKKSKQKIEGFKECFGIDSMFILNFAFFGYKI